MRKYMKALYAGSFDCYTNGHHYIVRQASRVFDELHIVVAVNFNKKRCFDGDAMVRAIEETLAEDGITNCVVTSYDSLVADYCRDNDIDFLVRGLRNSMDYNYEENVASVNKLLNPDLESIYFRSDNAAISSTMVRELLSFGRDVSSYVPGPVWRYIQTLDLKQR